MKRFLTISLLIFFLPKLSFCDSEKYEIKLMISPTFETMNPRNRAFRSLSDYNWKYKLSYNFGLEYKHYFASDVSISTGILYQDKGYRAVLDYKSPSPLYSNAVFITSFKYISIPTNLNIHFDLGKKSRALILFGLTNGYLMNGKGTYKRISNEDLNLIKDASSNIDIEDRSFDMTKNFKRRFTGLNLGVKYSKYILSKMIIELGATYSIQLNKASKPTYAYGGGNQYIVVPHFDSLILDFRIGYFFNNQISNKDKNF